MSILYYSDIHVFANHLLFKKSWSVVFKPYSFQKNPYILKLWKNGNNDIPQGVKDMMHCGK